MAITAISLVIIVALGGTLVGGLLVGLIVGFSYSGRLQHERRQRSQAEQKNLQLEQDLKQAYTELRSLRDRLDAREKTLAERQRELFDKSTRLAELTVQLSNVRAQLAAKIEELDEEKRTAAARLAEQKRLACERLERIHDAQMRLWDDFSRIIAEALAEEQPEYPRLVLTRSASHEDEPEAEAELETEEVEAEEAAATDAIPPAEEAADQPEQLPLALEADEQQDRQETPAEPEPQPIGLAADEQAHEDHEDQDPLAGIDLDTITLDQQPQDQQPQDQQPQDQPSQDQPSQDQEPQDETTPTSIVSDSAYIDDQASEQTASPWSHRLDTDTEDPQASVLEPIDLTLDEEDLLDEPEPAPHEPARQDDDVAQTPACDAETETDNASLELKLADEPDDEAPTSTADSSPEVLDVPAATSDDSQAADATAAPTDSTAQAEPTRPTDPADAEKKKPADALEDSTSRP